MSGEKTIEEGWDSFVRAAGLQGTADELEVARSIFFAGARFYGYLAFRPGNMMENIVEIERELEEFHRAYVARHGLRDTNQGDEK